MNWVLLGKILGILLLISIAIVHFFSWPVLWGIVAGAAAMFIFIGVVESSMM